MSNKIGNWKFVTHIGKFGGTVTAKCSVCNEPMFCNPRECMGIGHFGTVILSGYFRRDLPEKDRHEYLIERSKSKLDKLPMYCGCCGAKMLSSNAD